MKYTKFISIFYILFYSLGFRLKIFSKWPNTALPTVFWALTLVVTGVKYLEKEPRNRWMKGLVRMGKASYHIFLTQKLLFGFGLNAFLASFNKNIVVSTLLAVIVSCATGLLFYKIEMKG